PHRHVRRRSAGAGTDGRDGEGELVHATLARPTAPAGQHRGRGVLQGAGPPPSAGARPGARSARQRGGFVTRSWLTPPVGFEPALSSGEDRQRPVTWSAIRHVLALAAALL